MQDSLDKTYDVIDSTGTLIEEATPAPDPVIPKITRAQIGKIRKQHITVQHSRVVGCGHRLDLKRQPRHNNCENCWWAWFQNNGEMVKTADEAFQSGHPEIIVMLQGNKFYKNFLKFMATVARLEAQMKPQEESNE